MNNETHENDIFSENELESLSTHLEKLSQSLPKPFKDLGSTPLVQRLKLADDRLNGHWCSRCEGIWFGYGLEVECPVCGNRRG
jgi:hypothetical protein